MSRFPHFIAAVALALAAGQAGAAMSSTNYSIPVDTVSAGVGGMSSTGYRLRSTVGGFAIGSGADIALESADITLVGGDITRVAAGIELSRRTMSVIRQNLFWALGYNTVAIPVAAAGRLNPMIASAAMAMSSVSVLSNSLRLQQNK